MVPHPLPPYVHSQVQVDSQHLADNESRRDRLGTEPFESLVPRRPDSDRQSIQEATLPRAVYNKIERAKINDRDIVPDGATRLRAGLCCQR